jgi:hypothetical protein
MGNARRPLFWWMLVLIVMIPAIAFAASEKNEPVGKMIVNATNVIWTPTIDHESLLLTVVGPDGEAVVEDFSSGRSPVFQLGRGAADGTYHYEIRVAPRVSASLKKNLRDAGIAFAVTQDGTLTVKNGTFVSPDVAEGGSGSASMRTVSGDGLASNAKTGAGAGDSIIRLKPGANDIVNADDLIVQGSLCAGLDCVNNESFGFDTIRLKENNTRIKFDDTRSSAGFPANDWQLTANDSASGGASKFSIEDITGSKVPFTITAGASTNSIFVDSTGRVGFRTSTPVLDLHVTTGNTPALRFEQTNSSGFTAQTWDVAGNEANFFIRDVTGGSRLPFRIRPGAPTSSIDISANGNVGIGTASPGTGVLLDVQRTDNSATIISSTGNNASGIAILRAQSGNGTSSIRQSYVQMLTNETSPVDWRQGIQGQTDYRISDFSTGSAQVRFVITSAGNIGIGGVTTPANPLQHSSGAFLSAGGTWTNASSRELKEDICDLETQAAEETLKQLNPVTFRYKAAPTEAHDGFIAEDVPDLVAVEGRKGLSPMDIVAVLTKVVQQQQKVVEEQQQTIKDLAQKVEKLEKSQQ